MYNVDDSNRPFVYQSLWSVRWGKHWPTEEEDRSVENWCVAENPESLQNECTRRIVNLVSTIRNRMINRGHDTLSCSIEACCLSDTEKGTPYQFFFFFLFTDFDELRVCLRFIYFYLIQLVSIDSSKDKIKINRSKSIQSYDIKITFLRIIQN